MWFDAKKIVENRVLPEEFRPEANALNGQADKLPSEGWIAQMASE
jgi:hypothetical protein